MIDELKAKLAERKQLYDPDVPAQPSCGQRSCSAPGAGGRAWIHGDAVLPVTDPSAVLCTPRRHKPKKKSTGGSEGRARLKDGSRIGKDKVQFLMQQLDSQLHEPLVFSVPAESTARPCLTARRDPAEKPRDAGDGESFGRQKDRSHGGKDTWKVVKQPFDEPLHESPMLLSTAALRRDSAALLKEPGVRVDSCGRAKEASKRTGTDLQWQVVKERLGSLADPLQARAAALTAEGCHTESGGKAKDACKRTSGDQWQVVKERLGSLADPLPARAAALATEGAGSLVPSRRDAAEGMADAGGRGGKPTAGPVRADMGAEKWRVLKQHMDNLEEPVVAAVSTAHLAGPVTRVGLPNAGAKAECGVSARPVPPPRRDPAEQMKEKLARRRALMADTAKKAVSSSVLPVPRLPLTSLSAGPREEVEPTPQHSTSGAQPPRGEIRPASGGGGAMATVAANAEELGTPAPLAEGLLQEDNASCDEVDGAHPLCSTETSSERPQRPSACATRGTALGGNVAQVSNTGGAHVTLAAEEVAAEEVDGTHLPCSTETSSERPQRPSVGATRGTALGGNIAQVSNTGGAQVAPAAEEVTAEEVPARAPASSPAAAAPLSTAREAEPGHAHSPPLPAAEAVPALLLATSASAAEAAPDPPPRGRAASAQTDDALEQGTGCHTSWVTAASTTRWSSMPLPCQDRVPDGLRLVCSRESPSGPEEFRELFQVVRRIREEEHRGGNAQARAPSRGARPLHGPREVEGAARHLRDEWRFWTAAMGIPMDHCAA